MGAKPRTTTSIVLTAVVVIGLLIDAFVHFHLASDFAAVKTSVVSEATLFRVEAAGSVIAALALLARPNRYTTALAFLLALSGTVAVLLYRYVDLGAIGPIPNMYDPYWAPAEKTLSAIGEALAMVAALVLLMGYRQQSAIASHRDA